MPQFTDAMAKGRGFKNLAHWKREVKRAQAFLRSSLRKAQDVKDKKEVKRLQDLIKLNEKTLP